MNKTKIARLERESRKRNGSSVAIITRAPDGEYQHERTGQRFDTLEAARKHFPDVPDERFIVLDMVTAGL